MKFQVGAIVILVTLGVSSAFAGRIFGDVKVSGKPAAEGMLITLQPVAKPDDASAPAPPDSVQTDKVGSFKAMIKGEGKYTLTVYVGKQNASLEVFSYKEPTRYDLIVEEKEGKLTVRRK